MRPALLLNAAEPTGALQLVAHKIVSWHMFAALAARATKWCSSRSGIYPRAVSSGDACLACKTFRRQ